MAFRYYRSCKVVKAQAIKEVDRSGCVLEDATYRKYQSGMESRYTPVPGDYWLIYADGYEALSPKQAFEDGYYLLGEYQKHPEVAED
jgi:hypothetical protein